MDGLSIRVLVVGDSGVGKTALLHGICGENYDSAHAQCTVGCEFHVLSHTLHTPSLNRDTHYFIEFLDVGGHANYKSTRDVFYQDVYGILFVHDVSNIKSYRNLRSWLTELSDSLRSKGNFNFADIPKRILANKQDLVQSGNTAMDTQFEIKCIESIAVPHIQMDMHSFQNFIEQVISFAQTVPNTVEKIPSTPKENKLLTRRNLVRQSTNWW